MSLNPALAEESAPQDEILLKNGSKLLGTVTGSRDGVVTMETEFAGTLEVDMAQVEAIHTAAPAVLLMEDETVIDDVPLQVEGGELVVADSDRAYPLEQLSVLNPEDWELGNGYRWTGLANLALDVERGNSDKDELDYKLETVWLSLRDRYTLRLNGEYDKSNNEKTADEWQYSGKYDYFLTDPNYVGFLVFAEQNEFQDLDLRTMIGPYYGRQFYSEPIFTFSGELGLSWVDENFNVAEDQDYAALNWEINSSTDYLGGDSSIYFRQLGVWNLEDTGDVIVNSTFGLAFPLLWNFEAAAEVLWEYDSGAVDNIDDLDETYKFRIGYTW